MKFTYGKSIVTKFIGATNFRGSRIKASVAGPAMPSKVYSWNHELTASGNHEAAALDLAKGLGWPIDVVAVASSVGGGAVFTFLPPETEPTPELEYRVLIVPDYEEYQHGDYESEADRQDTLDAIEQNGVWGFVLESRQVGDTVAKWNHVDSCYGFIGGDDYIFEAATETLPVGLEVPCYYSARSGGDPVDLDPVRYVTKKA